MSAAVRKRLAEILFADVAQKVAIGIDGGIGMQAAAAIAAQTGLARELEIVRWVRRVRRAGLEHVAYVIRPDADRDEVAAHAELVFALQRDELAGARAA